MYCITQKQKIVWGNYTICLGEVTVEKRFSTFSAIDNVFTVIFQNNDSNYVIKNSKQNCIHDTD